jgi:hypothetical protein
MGVANFTSSQELTKMSDSLDLAPNNRRARFFFWLGVFVMPVFWSWFTLAGVFTRKERIMAFSGLVLFAVVIIVGWQRLEDYFDLLTIGWPLVIGWLTVALWGWLFFRLQLSVTLIEVIILIDVVAIAQPLNCWVRYFGRPFTIDWLVLPLIPLVLHLWLEPARVGFSKLERKRRVWQLLQFRKARAWWRRHCTFRSRSTKTR